ncbi:cbb3-type cytochrome c oxidase subunit I [Halobacteria archaeon HArc-gm2]|nr:cbb3-type cytochrome c oxidase subunit I [Halobacteria archaeon HArc-gm2]
MASAELAIAVAMVVVVVLVAVLVSRIQEWRWYSPLSGAGSGTGEVEPSFPAVDKPGGIVRWLTTVDHKDVGILYGVFGLVSFAWGGIAVVIMRTELLFPAQTLVDSNFYNALLTSHGITMLFLFGTPMIAAFGNYFIPLLIGADDMAFPRINAIAFWLLPPAAVLIWAGFFVPAFGPSQTSWTMYPPLSIEQPGPGPDLMLLGLHLSGISTTMGAINFMATIFTERGEDVNWATLDIFSWTILTQSGIILFAFPLLGSALIMLLLDRNLGTTFFTVDGGGPILWQHLFWFFGHPEVYILVLPPMGVVSYVLPRFSARKLFGFKFVVYSTLAIGLLSFGVWAHHMFATGIDPRLRASFMAVSLAIAIPSAVKTFNWITTMWNGRLRLTAPMLFCIGFVFNFIIGGVTGVFLAAVPVNLIIHDTYYVVGHFHYMVMGVIGFGLFAALYFWYPVVTGRRYQRTLAKWHFWLSMVGTNVVFFTMMVLGYLGMPRRYAAYDGITAGPLAQFTTLHQVTTVGAFILLLGQLLLVWNVVTSWVDGPVVRDGDVWNLEQDGLLGREFRWFDRELAVEYTASDGGEDTADDDP